MTTDIDPASASRPYGTANDYSSFLLGATIDRVYYAVPTSNYDMGTEFSNRDAAIAFAHDEIRKIKSGAKGEFAPAEVSVITRVRAVGLSGGTLDFQLESLKIKG